MTKRENSINLSKIAWGLLAILMTGALSWCAWVTAGMMDRPDTAGVYKIVETAAPYTRDKAAIDAKLDHVKQVEAKLAEVIEKNTDAINHLRVEIVKSRE